MRKRDDCSGVRGADREKLTRAGRVFAAGMISSFVLVFIATQASAQDLEPNPTGEKIAPVASAPGLAAAQTVAPSAEPIDRSLLLSYLVDKAAFTLIDARSPGEYEAGHVDGAVNISIDRVDAGNADLPVDLEKPILVYCKTNRRSTGVKDALLALGYSDVRVLPAEQLMFQENLIVFNCGA